MIAQGTAKLPLDQVRQVAVGLQSVPAELMNAAIRQYLDENTLALVYESAGDEAQKQLRRLDPWIVALAVASVPMREHLANLKTASLALADLSIDCVTDFDSLREELNKLAKEVSVAVRSPKTRLG